MYQSGCVPAETCAGLYGPVQPDRVDLDERRRAARCTPKTRKKKPPPLAAYAGYIRSPTTLCSVAPGPGNWVCF